jgi:hypothetical protein
VSAAKDVAAWYRIIHKEWAKRSSGTIFRSKDVFAWVAEGGVELSPADCKPINASGREIWRHRLSKALGQLADRQELLHPGISRHAWKVP